MLVDHPGPDSASGPRGFFRSAKIAATQSHRKMCRAQIGCAMTVTGIDWFRDRQALQVIDLIRANMGAARLITRRSQAQILSPQPTNQGLAAMQALLILDRLAAG